MKKKYVRYKKQKKYKRTYKIYINNLITKLAKNQ